MTKTTYVVIALASIPLVAHAGAPAQDAPRDIAVASPGASSWVSERRA